MKRMMTLGLAVILCCAAGVVGAEEAVSPAQVTPAAVSVPVPADETQQTLEYTLTTFRDSVDRLGKENKDIATANQTLKLKLKALEEQLGLVKAEEAGIAQQRKALEDEYQKKLPELQEMQVRYAEAVHSLEIIRSERGDLEQALKDRESQKEEAAAQYGELQKDIDAIRNGSPDAGLGEAKEKLESDKVRLEKELVDVSERVKNARAEWESLSAMVNGGPSEIEALQKEHDALQQEIMNREKEIVDLKAGIAKEEEFLSKIDEKVINPDTLASLETEIKNLEERLRSTQKANADLEKAIQEHKTQLAEAKVAVLKKKEETFKNAVEENKKLIREIERLQPEMVFLDKQKVKLEKGVY